jgi:signal transduction histidine kinase
VSGAKIRKRRAITSTSTQSKSAVAGAISAARGWVQRTRLSRSPDDRILTGVAGAMGRAARLDPILVRVAFVVLAFAGGAGAALYGIAYAFSTEGEAGASYLPPREGFRPIVAVTSIMLGLLLLLRAIGLWLGDAIVWPVALSALGAILVWGRPQGGATSPLHRVAERVARDPVDVAFGSRMGLGRVLGGVVLTLVGMIALIAENAKLGTLRSAIVPDLVVVSGLAVVMGPWLWRLGRQLSEERRTRIRSEERSEMAAHLHDSVLQTLALIQRSSSPTEMATLARTQERELRDWLFGHQDAAERTLAAAIEETAGRVEEAHQVRIEVVTVGEAPFEERLTPLIHSCAEALTNAAKHSQSRDISVFAEVEAEQVSVFIRDKGSGFDVDAIPSDRRGIAESIVGRMTRAGGEARITSSIGEGTEIMLTIPARR